MTNNSEIIKKNAMLSYWLILVNSTFLISKNPNLNNDFVKKHTKTAILIHIAFLINTIIFAYIWLGINIDFFWYSLSDIIAISIFLFLFWILLLWVYKAYNNELFSFGETIKYNKNIFGINNNNYNEESKLTIILSRIPFIGFIIYPKYKNNTIIENAVKLNLIITSIFIFSFIFGNNSLATIILLLYLIFIAFSAITLFINNETINIYINKNLSFKNLWIFIKTLKEYLKNYFSKAKEFKNFSIIFKEIEIQTNKTEQQEEKILQNKSNFKLPNKIIYIPILNFISIFNLDSKEKYHIINWIFISIVFIWIIILSYFEIISYKYLLLLLFPISFWIWYLNNNIYNYKIPILFNIYNLFNKQVKKAQVISQKIKTLKNTTKSTTLKVQDNTKNLH